MSAASRGIPELLMIAALGMACASGRSEPIKITATALKQQIAMGVAPTILDVRSEREFASGHVPGAIHIPFLEVRKRLGEISVDDQHPLVVYCGHGPRAYWARRVLRKHGADQVFLLEGHYLQWARGGHPVEK